MLRVTDATYGRRGQPITVRNASIAAEPGEVVAVIGTNGSGKSELVQGVAGLIPIIHGEVRVGNARVDRLPAHRVSRTGVALVPEGRRIFNDLTVLENLRVAVSRRDDALLDEILEQFPILAERRSQLAGSLSGGEQQQLAIARALVMRPSVLLLEEPSAGLSPVMTERVFSRLAELKRTMSIVVVEQVASLVLPVADRIYVMRGGRIVSEAGPDELRDAAHLHDLYFGKADQGEI